MHAHLLFQNLRLHMRPQLVLRVQRLPRPVVQSVRKGVPEPVELGARIALHPVQQRSRAVPAHQPKQHVPVGGAQHAAEDPADAQSALVEQAVQMTVPLCRYWSGTRLALAKPN